MLKGVTEVWMCKHGNQGTAKIFGDVYINFSGKDINSGCYVSQLILGDYREKFNLKRDEVESIETMAWELVATEEHNEYTIDLVKKTISIR